MSRRLSMRHRMSVLLHMATAFIIIILLAQLWLFTVIVDGIRAVETPTIAVFVLACSLVACLAVCGLIRLFLRAEGQRKH